MEFDVIDPKSHSFDEWMEKVEGFLHTHYPNFTLSEGELYYTRDDIAEPWQEESVIYRVAGEEGGLIELRGIDQEVYMFADSFAGRNLKAAKDGNTFHLTCPATVYGFQHNSMSRSRFHRGPIQDIYFLHQGEISDYPLPTPIHRLWGGSLLQSILWVHNQVGRFQELKRIFECEGTRNFFEMDVRFVHPASVNLILEQIRSRHSIKERERKRIRIYIENPSFDALRELFEVMPEEEKDYEELKLRMVWGVDLIDESTEMITYIGAEKRKLRPLVHLPRQKCAKRFRDLFREYFRGYRVDRQEYLLD